MLAQAMAGKPPQFEILDDSRTEEVSRKPLFGMDRKALSILMAEMGEPAWRGVQLAEAMYSQRVRSLDEVTTLPLALRRKMSAGWEIDRPAITQVFRSVDGTERYLVQGQAGS